MPPKFDYVIVYYAVLYYIILSCTVIIIIIIIMLLLYYGRATQGQEALPGPPRVRARGLRMVAPSASAVFRY